MPDKEKSNPASRNDQPTRPGVQIGNRRRLPRWLTSSAWCCWVLVVVGIVGFAGGTALEEHDSFCSSCHTVPETTYLNRSDAALVSASAVVSDLATYHFHQALTNTTSFQCIVCHRGDASLGNRIHSLALAMKDPSRWLAAGRIPPSERTTIAEPALVNAACVACHETTLLTQRGNATHFHNLLPATTALVAQGKNDRLWPRAANRRSAHPSPAPIATLPTRRWIPATRSTCWSIRPRPSLPVTIATRLPTKGRNLLTGSSAAERIRTFAQPRSNHPETLMASAKG